MTDKIAVIIPFYQEQPGILRRAIESVRAQTDVSDVEVIVVDDGSPRSAKDELRDFSAAPGISMRIIEQQNAGPGAARNKGLDNVTSDAAYVAFLDSDDEWLVDHLSRALTALQQGYDLYFSNFIEFRQEISVFERHELIELHDHIPLSGLNDAHEYRGDFFYQEITATIANTSTIVYRYAKFPDIRFAEQFRHAHEDTLWRLEISTRKPKIAFSSRPECQRGIGANVHYGAAWGTERALKIIYCNIMFRKLIQKKYKLKEVQASSNRERLNESRRRFASSALHLTLRNPVLGVSLIIKQSKMDPCSLLWLCYCGAIILKDKYLKGK